MTIGLITAWACSGRNKEMNNGLIGNNPLAAKGSNSRYAEDMKVGRFCTAILGFVCGISLSFIIGVITFAVISYQAHSTEMINNEIYVNNLMAAKEYKNLKDIAILLECTSFNDTKRWVEGILRQRHSRFGTDELPRFLFTNTENFSFYRYLKRLPRNHANFYFIQQHYYSPLISQVLKHPVNYIIEVKDTQFMGADFGDYYHFGRKVVENKDQVSCVCGGVSGQNETFFNKARGNVFWYQDQGCQMGPMRSREFYEATDDHSTLDKISRLKSRICFYPEVGRVDDNKDFVTRGYFRMAMDDETVWTLENYQKKILNDLKNALPMNDMDLKHVGQLDVDYVHYYRYKNLTKIIDFLGENRDFVKSRYFDTVIPIFYEGRRIYFISDDYYQKIASDL